MSLLSRLCPCFGPSKRLREPLLADEAHLGQFRADGQPYAAQITHVKDRPGHDRRYAIDARKIEAELGWRPAETFETGIRKTVQWFLDHADWVAEVQSGAYRDWVNTQYEGRA